MSDKFNDVGSVGVTRRRVLGGAVALGAMGVLPLLARGSIGRAGTASHSCEQNLGSIGEGVLIVVHLRGGADGLSLCVPIADPMYRVLRPTIACPMPGETGGCLALDSFFALPAAMEALVEPFRVGTMSIVHACGLEASSRRHAIEQKRMDELVATNSKGVSAEYLGAPRTEASGESTRVVRRVDAGVRSRPLIQQLQHAIGSIACDASIRTIVLEHTGYDTHREASLGGSGVSGPLAGVLRELALALRWFHDSALTGPNAFARPVTLLACSEFGRSVGENLERGTDHGAGGAAILMGNQLASAGMGGRALGTWPGLENLRPGDALPVTTDIRSLVQDLVGAGPIA